MPRRTKDAAIVALLVLNLVLLCAVVLHVLQLPRANAQMLGGRAGDRFLVVTGEIQEGYDAIYIIDAQLKQLYVLTPSRTVGQTAAILRARRNLELDFAKQPTPPAPRGDRRGR